MCRFRRAKSSTPSTVGVGNDGTGCWRSSAQQGVPAHREAPALAEAHPGLAAQGHPEVDEALGEPQGAPRPGSGHGGQPFGEDAATTGAIAAKPLADAQLEAHAVVAHGRSARVRAYRLWIRRAGMAHSGQGTLVCVERISKVIWAAVVST